MKTKKNVWSIISLAFGIASCAFYWLLPFLPVIAIATAIVALCKSKKIEGNGSKMAKIGLVLGIIYTLQISIKYIIVPTNLEKLGVNRETIEKMTNTKYCGGGEEKYCESGYSCAGPTKIFCAGGVLESCIGGRTSICPRWWKKAV